MVVRTPLDRRGLVSKFVDVSQLEIAALVQKGYLPEEAKHDTKAIKGAIEGVISDMVLDLKLV